MALDLGVFGSHIQGNDTSIYPFVLIDVDGLNIRISTNAVTIGADFHKPLLLNVPSLKESIDLETRKYKINSVTLDISNYQYEGVRFSELVESTSLMNVQVQIFWGSQYTTDYGSAFKIYDGTVRRYTHTEEKVKIELEDRSQSYLHKDLPLPENYLGDGEDVPDKYKNKPIPMVYGVVEKSPCVIKKKLEKSLDGYLLSNGSIEIYPDNVLSLYTKLYIYKNNKFAEVVKNNTLNDWSINVLDNNIIDSSTYENNPTTEYIRLKSSEGNFISKNLLPVLEEKELNNMNFSPLREKTNFFDKNEVGSTSNDHIFFTTILDDNTKEMIGTFVKDGYFVNSEKYNWNGESLSELLSGNNNDVFAVNMNTNDNERDVSGIGVSINTDTISENNWEEFITIMFIKIESYYGNMSANNWNNKSLQVKLFVQANTEIFKLQNVTFSNTGGSNWNQIENFILGGDDFLDYNYSSSLNENLDTNNIYFTIMPYNPSEATGYLGAFKCKFKQFEFLKYSLIKEVLDQDYYSLVKGRLSSNSYYSANPNMPDLVKNILNSELFFDGDYKNIQNNAAYSDMQYAFTVDKKINSKKLLEQIASASPYIPHFNNQSKFKFDVIPAVKVDSNHIIKESRIIDYSFSRTKIEDVKTKVEFKYKWDYARNEFGKVLSKQENNNDLYNYYGLDADHSKSTLVVDDHRGKYIRDELTADKFCQWLLDYYKNQHLIATIKLPLSDGLAIEVGDILEFDKLLGGIKPYGIDYTSETFFMDQEFYSNFIVTSTNKTLDMVTVQCEQLHQLLAVVTSNLWTTLYGNTTNAFGDLAINTPVNYAYGNITDTEAGWQDRLQIEIPSIKSIGRYQLTGMTGSTPNFQITNSNDYYNYEDRSGSLSGVLGFFEEGDFNNPNDWWVYGIELYDDSEITTNYFSNNMNVFGDFI